MFFCTIAGVKEASVIQNADGPFDAGHVNKGQDHLAVVRHPSVLGHQRLEDPLESVKRCRIPLEGTGEETVSVPGHAAAERHRMCFGAAGRFEEIDSIRVDLEDHSGMTVHRLRTTALHIEGERLALFTTGIDSQEPEGASLQRADNGNTGGAVGGRAGPVNRPAGNMLAQQPGAGSAACQWNKQPFLQIESTPPHGACHARTRSIG